MSNYAGPDEYPIKAIPDTPQWSENFAAMYSCPSTKVAVFLSIGRWHSDPTIWREMIMISLPDGRTLYTKGYGRGGNEKGPGGSLGYYEVVEPGEKTRLTFNGPMFESTHEELMEHGNRSGPTGLCKVDLLFEGIEPIWNMKGDSKEASNMAGGIHIDHIGKVNGLIEFKGEKFPIKNGYVARDHSRGVRDVSHYGSHNWINGSFSNGRAFYLYAMRSPGVEAIGMSNATMVQDGTLYPAEVVSTKFISSTEGLDDAHIVVLKSELGTMEIEIAEVLNRFSTSMYSPYDIAPGNCQHLNRAIIVDESVRLKWDGQEAFGWCERGHTEKPLVD